MADALIPGPSRACNTKEAIMSFCVLVKWKCVAHTWSCRTLNSPQVPCKSQEEREGSTDSTETEIRVCGESTSGYWRQMEGHWRKVASFVIESLFSKVIWKEESYKKIKHVSRENKRGERTKERRGKYVRYCETWNERYVSCYEKDVPHKGGEKN